MTDSFIIQITDYMLKIAQKKRFQSLQEFQILEGIGDGSRGKVKLARHGKTCRMYALKVIDLDCTSQAELQLVQREIQLHSRLDHPHIIKLWETLADQHHIYMVMEYAEHGTLFTYQRNNGVLSEAQAGRVLAQTVEGVQYLHGLDMLHRDLKPENLLLDGCLNVKICDFGWTAQPLTARRTAFCGTYEYMAPEMLFKSHYDYRVDIWALGVLLYEMLHGSAPFNGRTASQVQQAMLQGGYHLAPHLSQEVKKLIRSLLQFQAHKRPSLQQIRDHKWMKDVEQQLNNCTRLQAVTLPREIPPTFINLGKPPSPPRPKTYEAKHRKNNSAHLNSCSSININLAINNFAFTGKCHSHDKHSQPANTTHQFHLRRASLNKTNPSYNSQLHIHHIIQNIHNTKLRKENDQARRMQKDSRLESKLNKKKFKMRRSEVGFSEKAAVRLNTETNEKEQQQPANQNLLVSTKSNSKSMLRIWKSPKFQ